MKFAKAYEFMKQGKRIKVPEWEGYWYWNNVLETIVIHTKTGEELDIRDTQNVDFTFSFINRDDWIVF